MNALENKAVQLNELHEVFVPFDVVFIEGCEVIYLNESLCQQQTPGEVLASSAPASILPEIICSPFSEA